LIYALQLDPQDSHLWAVLCEVERESGTEERARIACAQAEVLSPDLGAES
jgi:cytochrome c-type biogenesis protein CcmH/NrfG